MLYGLNLSLEYIFTVHDLLYYLPLSNQAHLREVPHNSAYPQSISCPHLFVSVITPSQLLIHLNTLCHYIAPVGLLCFLLEDLMTSSTP